jgi:hypothetical protein
MMLPHSSHSTGVDNVSGEGPALIRPASHPEVST